MNPQFFRPHLLDGLGDSLVAFGSCYTSIEVLETVFRPPLAPLLPDEEPAANIIAQTRKHRNRPFFQYEYCVPFSSFDSPELAFSLRLKRVKR